MRGVALNSSPTLGAPGFWLACHTCHRAISAPRRFDIHATDRTVPCALPIIHPDQAVRPLPCGIGECDRQWYDARPGGDENAARRRPGGGHMHSLSARSISLAGL